MAAGPAVAAAAVTASAATVVVVPLVVVPLVVAVAIVVVVLVAGWEALMMTMMYCRTCWFLLFAQFKTN